MDLRPSAMVRLAPACLVVAGCGGLDAPAALGERAGEVLSEVHYLPGEHLEWEVTWFGVLVGRVQLAVGGAGELDGRPAVVVRSLARSDGAFGLVRPGAMELTTWVDLERGQPLAQEGSFDEIYRGEVFGVRFEAIEWPRTEWSISLPGGKTAQSSHTALGLVRGWRPLDGERAHLYVKLRDQLLRLDLVALGRERAATPLGRREALHIGGVATPLGLDLRAKPGARGYPLSVWIEEGDERVPVRMELDSGQGGSVQLKLVTYDPPGTLE